jgi:hypothetical protein
MINQLTDFSSLFLKEKKRVKNEYFYLTLFNKIK